MNDLSSPAVPPPLAGSIESLAVALRHRDAYTDGHCNRVGLICQSLGRRCGMGRAEQPQLALAARFHDIGKIGIPDRILLRDGPLDADERRLMQTHSERGEQIFLASRHRHAGGIARLIRHHHEAFDGSGYPDGLRAARIPLGARILRIADSYDAMTSRRPYGRVRSHAEAMQVLRLERGSKIDPELFAEFERLAPDALGATDA